MAYNKTQWIAHETIVSADNLNKIEDGIYEAHKEIEKIRDISNIEDKINEAVEDAKEYTNEKVADLVGSAPETLDTLKELSDALGGDENFAATVARQIGEKLGKTENAVSASKLATARNIAITGDVIGSVNFNGDSDVSIKADAVGLVGSVVFRDNTQWLKICTFETSFNNATTPLTFSIRGRYNQSFSEEVSIKLKGGVYQTTDINSFVYTGEGKYAKNLKIVKPTESPRFELWLERVGSWDSITLSNISVHKGEITMTWNKQPTNTFPTEYVALHTPTADTSISEQIETLVEQRVDERLSTLTQLLVAKGILEADNPAVIPELE